MNGLHSGIITSLILVTFFQTAAGQIVPLVKSPPDWRDEARHRIQETRMAGLKIHLVDSGHNPLVSSPVSVRLVRHAFPFGAVLRAESLMQSGAEGDLVRDLAARELGRISFLDDLNWNNWDQTSRRDCTIEALNWCHARGISVRARGLMIPIWKLMPFEMRNIQNRPNLLRRWLEELARERVAAASGRVQVWDVVQEPIDQQEIFKVVGDRVVADWLKIARQEDSQALLAVNVSGLINFNGRDSERFERWSALRQLWKEKGAPLDQLGIQAKFWEGSETSPDRLWEILDQLSVDGMSLELTELEVASRNKAAAAAYLKDVLLLAFSHPAVKGITVDGFWLDGRVRPGNNLYTKEGLPTQLGQAWLDLIWGEWATKVAGLTTSAGEFEWRGFPGIYRVEFAGGKTMEVELKPGATVEISPESGNNP